MAKKTEESAVNFNTEITPAPVVKNPSDKVKAVDKVEDVKEKVILKTVTVVKAFRDKNDHKTWYSVGSKQKFEASRAQDIVARGFGKFAEV
jgi:hypothetical protein